MSVGWQCKLQWVAYSCRPLIALFLFILDIALDVPDLVLYRLDICHVAARDPRVDRLQTWRIGVICLDRRVVNRRGELDASQKQAQAWHSLHFRDPSFSPTSTEGSDPTRGMLAQVWSNCDSNMI